MHGGSALRRGDRRRAGADAARADDERGDDRRHGADGAGPRGRALKRRRRSDAPSSAAWPAATIATLDRAAVGVLARAAVGARGSPSLDPDDPDSPYRVAGDSMKMHRSSVRRSVAACSRVICSSVRRVRQARGAVAQATAAAGPSDRSTSSRVVEQPLNVDAVAAGELNPYQTVAIYPRVTGFVKTIRVDRGIAGPRGRVLAILEAPELVAQRAEAQSKLQARKRSSPRCSRRRMRTRARTTG